MNLQERAKAFLERPIPEEMDYVPDSLSERFIAEYAMNREVMLDAELAELLEICILNSEITAQQKQGAEREFFQESAAILRAIQEEAHQDG